VNTTWLFFIRFAAKVTKKMQTHNTLCKNEIIMSRSLNYFS
jgi:hypothetical protein